VTLMRRLIYLHIGFPKTGTTSIQMWLTENTVALAAHGVLYPRSGREGQESHYGHHQLPRSLVESPLSELTVAWPDMTRLRNEMDNSPAQIIVVSSEDFSTRLKQPEVDLLARHLADFDVRIVCYVRRQDEFIISVWSTAVAHYGESDPLACCLDHSWLDYAATIAPWARAFGPSAIVLRVFERSQLVGGDAVEDFLSVCGINASAGFTPLPHTHHNRRLPAHISLIQAYLNAHKIDRATIARLSTLSSMLDHHEVESPLFARGDRMALLARHAEGNSSLVQTYLGRSDGSLFYDLTMPDDGAPTIEVNADTHDGVASAIALLVDDAYIAVATGNHLPATAASRDLPESFRSMSDDAWLETLLRSTSEPTIDGFRFPGYPDRGLQATSVESYREAAMREAFNFYVLAKAYARALAMPLTLDSRFLDFGVGWGRFLRVFWKDVRATNLYGCDVDPNAITTCRTIGVPGEFDRLCPQGRLPYPDGFFRGGIACSAFIHLSQPAHLHWMRELGRVLHPGAVFCMALRSRPHDYSRELPDRPESARDMGVDEHSAQIDALQEPRDHDGFLYLQKEQNPRRPPDDDGEAIVPLSFVEREWAGKFAVRAYVDRPSQYGEAIVILQRF
jgi:SAM-dependent methyltransferase